MLVTGGTGLVSACGRSHVCCLRRLVCLSVCCVCTGWVRFAASCQVGRGGEHRRVVLCLVEGCGSLVMLMS